MRSSLRVFVVIESLLLLWALYQMLGNVPAIIFLTFAIINLFYALKKRKKTSFNQFQLIASIIIMVLSLLSSPAIWLALVLAVIYFGLVMGEVSEVSLFNFTPWKKKQIKMIQTTTRQSRAGKRFKRPWVGSQRLGSDTYEWDDINFSVMIGDTIIDLGNTLLPKEDNVIIIRKGFGRTRILVPTGIGIMLEHSSMRGAAHFEQEVYYLNNESLKLYSDDYDESKRRLKIITNTLFGDLEVIRV
ncbi:cell wall-active antibiotics response protein LiaF [Vagococcus sp. JNUCC 83]